MSLEDPSHLPDDSSALRHDGAADTGSQAVGSRSSIRARRGAMGGRVPKVLPALKRGGKSSPNTESREPHPSHVSRARTAAAQVLSPQATAPHSPVPHSHTTSVTSPSPRIGRVRRSPADSERSPTSPSLSPSSPSSSTTPIHVRAARPASRVLLKTLPVRTSQVPAVPSPPRLSAAPGPLRSLNPCSSCIHALLQLPTATRDESSLVAEQTCHSLFDALKAAIAEDPDPTIRASIEAIESNPLSRVMRQPGWKWKDHHATLTQTEATQRVALVDHICTIVDVLAKREGITRPEVGWGAFGTPGVASDIDQSMNVIKGSRFPLADNAAQGQVAVMGSLVWRALLGGTSLAQADTEFYPPHIARYLELGLLSDEEAQLGSTAHYAAQFMQFRLQLHDDTQWAAYKAQVLEKFTDSHQLAAISGLFEDVEAVHRQTNQITAALPANYRDMGNTFMCNEISKQLRDVGRKLDRLKTEVESIPFPSSTRLRGIKNERQLLLRQFALLATARETFVPEGYLGQGAFAVICKNQGGQQHVMADLELENAVRGGGLVSRRGSHEPNTLAHLLGSVGENAAYFLHRNDLIDGSKYGLRVYSGTLQSLHQLRQQLSHSPTLSSDEKRQLLAEIDSLEATVVTRLDEMSVLEGSKRKKWDRVSLITTAIMTQKKEAKLQLEAAIERLTGKAAGGPVAESDEEAAVMAEVEAERRGIAAVEKRKILEGGTPQDIVAAYASALKLGGIDTQALMSVGAVRTAMNELERWQVSRATTGDKDVAIQAAKEQLWRTLTSAALQVGVEKIESPVWRGNLSSAISEWFARNTPGSSTFTVPTGVSADEVAGLVRKDFTDLYRSADNTPFPRSTNQTLLHQHAVARLAPPLALQGAVLHVARAAVASSLTDNPELRGAVQDIARSSTTSSTASPRSSSPTTDILWGSGEETVEVLSPDEQLELNRERTLGAAKDLSIPIQVGLARQTMRQMASIRPTGVLLEHVNREIVETHVALMDLANRAHAIQTPSSTGIVTMAGVVRDAALACGF